MPKANETAAKLESAKERLRAALTRLEHAAEKKAREARNAAPADNKSAELKEKLELAANENKQLKSENEKLAILQAKAARRVERLIDEVKQVVGK